MEPTQRPPPPLVRQANPHESIKRILPSRELPSTSDRNRGSCLPDRVLHWMNGRVARRAAVLTCVPGLAAPFKCHTSSLPRLLQVLIVYFSVLQLFYLRVLLDVYVMASLSVLLGCNVGVTSCHPSLKPGESLHDMDEQTWVPPACSFDRRANATCLSGGYGILPGKQLTSGSCKARYCHCDSRLYFRLKHVADSKLADCLKCKHFI
ncbi:hypothetical protein F4780DRAFT_738705 [Xylariomycetidae sp. FL0641]|nr:hypothetical protein F4780DRAFT_738705 [Xylariomycetidae sp. FL0641]